METEMASKKLFWKPIALKRSTRSKTGMTLYSADVTRDSGNRGDRLEIYFRVEPFPRESADKILVLAYEKMPSLPSTDALLLPFRLSDVDRTRYANSTTLRYRTVSDIVTDVYFPRAFVKHEPTEIWLVIMEDEKGRSLRRSQR